MAVVVVAPHMQEETDRQAGMQAAEAGQAACRMVSQAAAKAAHGEMDRMR